jgi:hypothetical protein
MMHLVDALVKMQLTASGKSAECVSFSHNNVKMVLLKGPDALAARRAVASKLDHSAMKALRRPMHVDKPDWSLMQQLRPRRVIAESDDEPRAQAHAARRGLRRRRRRIRTVAGSAVARIECARERARARARARA